MSQKKRSTSEGMFLGLIWAADIIIISMMAGYGVYVLTNIFTALLASTWCGIFLWMFVREHLLNNYK